MHISFKILIIVFILFSFIGVWLALIDSDLKTKKAKREKQKAKEIVEKRLAEYERLRNEQKD